MTQIPLGGDGAVGCQNDDSPPTLDNGALASALYELTYDQETARLTLVVHNTSPVVQGEPNPLLSQMWLNFPDNVVDGARLVSQTGSGGAPPDFHVHFGNEGGGCFGKHTLRLHYRSPFRGISNPHADTINANSNQYTVGPVTFEIDLEGPGVDWCDARSLAHGFSTRTENPVNVMAKFQKGGPRGNGDGYIANGGEAENCVTSMWITGRPFIGNVVDFWRRGRRGCHDCLWLSLHPGPTIIGDIRIPIGLPLLFSVDAGSFPVEAQRVPLPIPNNSRLIGRNIYFVLATFPPDGTAGTTPFQFGESFVVTVQAL